MASTFECPFCESRYNNWVASVWVSETETEVSTYQCKQCLNLFENRVFCGGEDETVEAIIEM